jgi:hypothetical protein
VNLRLTNENAADKILSVGSVTGSKWNQRMIDFTLIKS